MPGEHRIVAPRGYALGALAPCEIARVPRNVLFLRRIRADSVCDTPVRRVSHVWPSGVILQRHILLLGRSRRSINNNWQTSNDDDEDKEYSLTCCPDPHFRPAEKQTTSSVGESEFFSTLFTVVLCPKGGTKKGDDRSNVDPLSAVIRGYDVAVPEDIKAVSDRVGHMFIRC